MSALGQARATVEAAGGSDAQRMRILEFIDAHDDALERRCQAGHLTGSAAIVAEGAARVLLLHHRKLDRWLQPGGHADGDGDIAAVAEREVLEETGLAGVLERPAIDLDVHDIPARPGEPAHVHLDVRFRLRVAAGAVAVANHESRGLRWVGLEQLEDPVLELDVSTKRLVRVALLD
ncbi:MAG: NUDIX hydrolase [Acidimicrobiales bacterium]